MRLHKHHIIPKHAGGTDHPSNIAYLTIEEHAEAHRKLYEQYGRWQDELAYKGLLKKIGKDEILHQKAVMTGRMGGLALSGKPKSEQHKEKILKLKQCFTKNHVPWNKGGFLQQSTKEKISKSLTGKKQSQDTIIKRAKANRHPRRKYNCSKKENIICPHCEKVGHPNPMRRWHFNNCRTR